MDSTPSSDGESARARDDLLQRLTRGREGSRYKVEGEVARGGMGAILRVWDDDLRRHLAMKVILSSRETVGDKELARFLEEAQVTGQLDHPGIVPVHELGLDSEGRVYFTMKLVKGRDLKQIFDLVFRGAEGWNETRALGVILKVCEAMAYAHAKGVIHRDLKPANVMVGNFGEVFVMDWGLARVLGTRDRHDIRLAPEFTTSLHSVKTERRDEREDLSDSPIVTMDGDVVGTPAYMPIEQAHGQIEKLTPRSDVYAIGAMIYHLLARHPPYTTRGSRASNRMLLAMVMHGPPAPLSEVRKDVPAELVAICEKAMAREPEHRYADTLALAEDLRAYLEHRVVGAYETGTWAETRKWVQRNKPLAASLAAVVLFLAAGLTTSLVFKSRADARAADLTAANATIRDRERAARENLYLASISAAESSRRLAEPGNVRRLLDSAPAELREFEWRYLDAASDTSLCVLNGGAWAELSPDGSRIVTASTDGTAYVWDAASGTEELRLVGHTAALTHAAFSPKGSRIVTSSDDGTARVWDAERGNELARFTAGGKIDKASFVSGGSHVVTVSTDDRTIRTFDVARGAECARFAFDSPLASSVAVEPNGSRIAVASADGAQVWDAVTREELARFAGRTTLAAFSADGTKVATGGADDTVRIFDSSTGSEVRRLSGHTKWLQCVSFSPDGSRIATSAFDSTARLWDVESGRELARLEGDLLAAATFAFDPTSSLIALTHQELCGPRLWDPARSQEMPRLEGHIGPIGHAAFNADGTRLLTCSNDGTTRVWDAARRSEPGTLVVHSTVQTAEFSPDGARVVTGSTDGSVLVFDATTGAMLARLDGLTGFVDRARFTQGGERIVASASDGSACTWDAASGKLVARIPGAAGSVNAWFSADGSLVAHVTPDRNVRLVDASTGRTIAELQRGNQPSSSRARFSRFLSSDDWAVFSPDGSRVVVESPGGEAVAYDTATGLKAAELRGHGARVRYAEFDRRGARIVTASEDGTARVWDAASGAELARLKGHTAAVLQACFSPDGSRVVTAAWDRAPRVWDAESGRELAQLRGHTSALFGVSFSPDGSRILTVAGTSARLWDAASGQPVLRLEGHTDIVHSARFSADGTRIVSASEDRTARVWDSVPYRERYGELQALARARPAAEEVVGRLLESSSGFVEAGSRLRTERSLDETVKRAAFDLLLERASRARERADERRSKSLERTWLARILGAEPWPDERAVAAELDTEITASADARDLNALAWRIVDPDAPPSGQEVRALVLARRAVAGVSEEQSAPMRDTLARALYRVGRFDEALEEQRRALALAPAVDKAQYEALVRRLEADIAVLRDETGAQKRATIAERITALEREIAALEQDPDVLRWSDESSR